MASPNDTRITPAQTFDDALGVVWSVSYRYAQRNGYNTTAQASEGLWHGNVYMKGRNGHWWQLIKPDGNQWKDVGADDPSADNPSPDDVHIAAAESFVDALDVTWTISYGFAQRNGYNTTAHALEGLWHADNVYMLGRNRNWWRLVTPAGNTWVDVGPNDPAAVPPPTITGMTATPATLPVGGGAVTIDATVTDASSLTLDGVAIFGLPATTSTTESHTFRLVATNTAGAQTATASVTVATAPVEGTDPLLIYDGYQGIIRRALYGPYLLTWRNPGGDWLDADGKPQGSMPFSEITLRTGQAGPYLLDVTRLVQEGGEPQICLRKFNNTASGAIFTFSARESGQGPTLVVTNTDDSTDTIPVMYDVECNTTTDYEKGKNGTLIIGASSVVYLRFPQPQKPVKQAMLVLNGTVNTGGRLAAFKFAVHRGPIPTETFTLEGDPRIFLETETFSGPETPYCTKALIFNATDSTPPNYNKIVDIGGGQKALQLTFNPAYNNVLNATVPFPDFAEADEAAVEFEIRLLPDMEVGIADAWKCFAGFRASTKNDDTYLSQWTKKADDPPAWAMKNIPGRCGTLLAGNSGVRSHGKDGWSLRFDMWDSPLAPHPLAGRWLPTQYVYWPEQADTFGDMWRYTGTQSMLLTNRWYKIAQRCKINTCVGENWQRDAEFDSYIDGHLAVRKRDFYMRTTDNPLIAQPITPETPWAGVDSELRIGSIWLATYHGGTAKPLAKCSFQIRNFRAAKFA